MISNLLIPITNTGCQHVAVNRLQHVDNLCLLIQYTIIYKPSPTSLRVIAVNPSQIFGEKLESLND